MITACLDKVKAVHLDFNLEVGSVDVILQTITVTTDDTVDRWERFDPIRLRMSIDDWHRLGKIFTEVER